MRRSHAAFALAVVLCLSGFSAAKPASSGGVAQSLNPAVPSDTAALDASTLLKNLEARISVLEKKVAALEKITQPHAAPAMLSPK